MDMIIKRFDNYVQFQSGNNIATFPLRTLVAIANEGSDSINIRLLSNNGNVLTFDYHDVAEMNAESATEAVEIISTLIN